MTEPLSARERIALHGLCREMDDLAEQAPWAAWVLRPFARFLRWADAEAQRHDDFED